jgi:hypothetical protein
MKSVAVLRAVLPKAVVKQVAADLGLHENTLYKWCEPDGGKAAGVLNPLERLAQLLQSTQDVRLVEYVCELAGGHFVRNRAVASASGEDLLPATVAVLGEMGHLSAAVSEAVKDCRVTKAEAAELRSGWNQLQAEMELFMAGCEQNGQLPHGASARAEKTLVKEERRAM